MLPTHQQMHLCSHPSFRNTKWKEAVYNVLMRERWKDGKSLSLMRAFCKPCGPGEDSLVGSFLFCFFRLRFVGTHVWPLFSLFFLILDSPDVPDAMLHKCKWWICMYISLQKRPQTLFWTGPFTKKTRKVIGWTFWPSGSKWASQISSLPSGTSNSVMQCKACYWYKRWPLAHSPGVHRSLCQKPIRSNEKASLNEETLSGSD